MSWLVKSAGIIMSEIILGNAGVGCKGAGKRQFITSLGSDIQPTHAHTATAMGPASLSQPSSQALLHVERETSAWLGHLSDDRGTGRREGPGIEQRFLGITWCHQIQEPDSPPVV